MRPGDRGNVDQRPAAVFLQDRGEGARYHVHHAEVLTSISARAERRIEAREQSQCNWRCRRWLIGESAHPAHALHGGDGSLLRSRHLGLQARPCPGMVPPQFSGFLVYGRPLQIHLGRIFHNQLFNDCSNNNPVGPGNKTTLNLDFVRS